MSKTLKKPGVSEVGSTKNPTRLASGTHKTNSVVTSPKQLVLGSGNRRNALRTFIWRASETNTELTRSVGFWHVRSNCKEISLLRFLRLKFFWGELLPAETLLAFDHPGFLHDVEFSVALSLRANTKLTRSEIAERLQNPLKLLGRTSMLRKELLNQWEHNLCFIADLERKSISKRLTFSGWVRSASQVGSKRSSLSLPEPEDLEVFGGDVFDEFDFLYSAVLEGSVESNSLTFRFSSIKS